MSDNGPLAEDAQNVELKAVSSDSWEVVTESGHVVGRIVKDGDRFGARNDADEPLGSYDTAELAMFGIVNPA
jgi:hypothetical protein